MSPKHINSYSASYTNTSAAPITDIQKRRSIFAKAASKVKRFLPSTKKEPKPTKTQPSVEHKAAVFSAVLSEMAVGMV